LPLLAAGCIPLGMVWLPDSSGFIYPAGQNAHQIMFYDAAKREHRVLIEDTGATTLFPGLSPDGKRIAVARIYLGEDNSEMAQVVIYDKDGKELHRSPETKWRQAQAQKKEENVGTIVFWDRAGKRVLFSAPFQGNDVQTGLYDPGTKQFRSIAGVLLPFGGTPVRPDGKGFLVAGGGEKAIAFVDWEGHKQNLKLDPEAAADNDRAGILSFPWCFASQWDGDRAQVSYKHWRIRLDTKKGAASLDKRPDAEARVDDFFLQHQYTFAGGVKVRALVHEDKEGKLDKSRLEIITPGADKPRVLVEQGKGLFGFSPSPNKKLLAIWCVDDGTGKPYVYVLNSAGDVV